RARSRKRSRGECEFAADWPWADDGHRFSSLVFAHRLRPDSCYGTRENSGYWPPCRAAGTVLRLSPAVDPTEPSSRGPWVSTSGGLAESSPDPLEYHGACAVIVLGRDEGAIIGGAAS